MPGPRLLHLNALRLILCLALLPLCSHAQTDTLTYVKVKKDSVVKPVHSPKKAAIFSACLPGLGQGYNRKYWKIPVIYAGLGTFGYLVHYSHSLYKGYKDEYIYRQDHPNMINEFPDLSADQLKVNVDQYRRYRDLSAILTLAVYALNIVDANVDAHLFTFDVSNDISFHWQPAPLYNSFSSRPAAGISFGLKF